MKIDLKLSAPDLVALMGPEAVAEVSAKAAAQVAEHIIRIEAGAFNQYDGSGYYSNGTEYDDNFSVWAAAIPHWATHILWFNK